MILLAAGLGTRAEAFIERRFKERVNVIYSNDNNRGKTVLIQSIMHSIGNNPIFPASFDPKGYFFYSKFSHEGRIVEFLRRGNNFVVKDQGKLNLLDSVTDFKMYFSTEILPLPAFLKDGRSLMPDLHLFFQMFFLPQDKRNTSNIINGGQFNKADFNAMLQSLANPENKPVERRDLEQLKNVKKTTEEQIGLLRRRMRFARRNPAVAAAALETAGNSSYEEISNVLKLAHDEAAEFSKKRIRETNRIVKLESLLAELTSLNRNIEIGKVQCADCQSDKIVYRNGDINFELSNEVVRREVYESIKKQIHLKKQVVDEYGREISVRQREIQQRLEAIPIHAIDIIISREQILREADADQKIRELEIELDRINFELGESKILQDRLQVTGTATLRSIAARMRDIYEDIDEISSSGVDEIFTKATQTYSGSEEQIFLFSRIVAIHEAINPPFPVVIDSFRDGEISTEKERKMISYLESLGAQAIITSTLKDEEYSTQKYPQTESLNALDYSEVPNSKILQEAFAEDFAEILDSFGVA